MSISLCHIPVLGCFFRTEEVAFVHFSLSRDADRVKLTKT